MGQCSRSGGHGWRCPDEALPGFSLCERHNDARKENMRYSRRQLRLSNQQLVDKARNKPCTDYTRIFPSRAGFMYLDHVCGIKSFELTTKNMSLGQQVVIAEIAKCDPRCVICHLARHAGLDWQEVWDTILNSPLHAVAELQESSLST